MADNKNGAGSCGIYEQWYRKNQLYQRLPKYLVKLRQASYWKSIEVDWVKNNRGFSWFWVENEKIGGLRITSSIF